MMSGKVRRRGRPRNSNINRRDANVNLDLDDNLLLEYEIKNCSVELTPINLEQSAMDETSPTPSPVAPKRRGRKPKNALATKTNETPTKPAHVSDDTKPNDEQNESIGDESMEKAEKPVKLSLSERKQARKAQIEAIIASGGRGMRTRKPNPKYMDEPAVSFKDDDEENAEGEDGDDEMNLSSDDLPRNEGPLKKRMLQKVGIKSGPGRKPGSGKGTPGRKPASIIAIKRKFDIDIDIDDEHGKQLFLDAKRRFQNSPSGSEDDGQLKKSKSPITDALAAKLRSKYPNDSFTVKRTVTVDNKNSPINRVRLLERSKLAVKDGRIELRQREFTEDTETSEDDFGRGASDQDGSSPKNINRRKTQHTKILSDDKIIRPSSSGTPTTIIRKHVGSNMATTRPINKSPLTQSQLIQSKLGSSSTAKTYSISSQSRMIGSNKPAILRQPPRILNSTLCKPTNKVTVPSLVTKVVTKDDYESDLTKKRNNNIISSRSKENNVTSYVYTEKDGKMVPKRQIIQTSAQKLSQHSKTILPVVRTPPTQQRIISEPVTMNIPNSRRIRKITCFETWYVIKMIEEQPKVEKSILNMSLMQIGNEIKKIELPSSEWNYKILLQPLNKHFLALRQTKANKNLTDTKSNEAKEKSATTEKPNETDDKIDNETDTEQSDAKSPVKSESEDINKEANSNDKEESTKSPKEDKSNAEDNGSATSSDEKEPKEETNSADKTDEEKFEENVDEKAEQKSEEESEEQKEQKSEVLEKSTEKNESNDHDVYTGEVHDPNINQDEKHNYRPINIMFRRKCQNPNIRIQFDRTVILKNQTYYLNVDGKNVRLVASPQQIDTYDDIASLLQIVNDISLNSCCVELATHVG